MVGIRIAMPWVVLGCKASATAAHAAAPFGRATILATLVAALSLSLCRRRSCRPL